MQTIKRKANDLFTKHFTIASINMKYKKLKISVENSLILLKYSLSLVIYNKRVYCFEI
jgi:hypothetical protein